MDLDRDYSAHRVYLNYIARDRFIVSNSFRLSLELKPLLLCLIETKFDIGYEVIIIMEVLNID